MRVTGPRGAMRDQRGLTGDTVIEAVSQPVTVACRRLPPAAAAAEGSERNGSAFVTPVGALANLWVYLGAGAAGD